MMMITRMVVIIMTMIMMTIIMMMMTVVVMMMIPWVKAQGASVLCEVCKHVGRVEEAHLDIIIIRVIIIRVIIIRVIIITIIIIIIIPTIIIDILIIIVVEKRMAPFKRILPWQLLWQCQRCPHHCRRSEDYI